MLEPALAEKAAGRVTDEEREEIHVSVQRMRDAIDDRDAFLRENDRFHMLVAAAAENEVLSLFIASLSWITDATPLGVDYTHRSANLLLTNTSASIGRSAYGDTRRAGIAMANHIEDFASYLERKHPSVLDAPVRWDGIDW